MSHKPYPALTMYADDIDRLLDNAACASQCRDMLYENGRETVLREAVRMNVVEPLLERIYDLEAQLAKQFEIDQRD